MHARGAQEKQDKAPDGFQDAVNPLRVDAGAKEIAGMLFAERRQPAL
jgi:hypothetical protein